MEGEGHLTKTVGSIDSRKCLRAAERTSKLRPGTIGIRCGLALLKAIEGEILARLQGKVSVFFSGTPNKPGGRGVETG